MKFTYLLPIAASCLFAACGEAGKPGVSTVNSAASPSPAKAPASHIALVMKTLTNPFFVKMENGARRAESELGIVLTVKAAAQETSIDQQEQIIDDLIVNKVDAIVIAPGDSQSLVPILKKAAAAGIKIVNIDNRLDAALVSQAGFGPVPFVSIDNENAAYLATKQISGDTATHEAAILEGIRSADNSQQRVAGAKRAFAESPTTRIVATETANWKIDEGYTVTKSLFAKHPNITLLFAANDMMALGAIRYLDEAGRHNVKVAAFDALDEAISAVKSKALYVTVDQKAEEQGYQGVVLATRLLKGEKVMANTYVEPKLITFDTAK